MKRNLAYSIIAFTITFLFGCSEDGPKSKSISGTWIITEAVGVEWQENAGNTGAGTIINTNNPDVDMIDQTFVIEGTEINMFGDSYDFEYSNGVITIDFGAGDTESFNVEFEGSNTMLWTQDAPSAHSDYEEKNPGQFLFYQKSFTLERQ